MMNLLVTIWPEKRQNRCCCFKRYSLSHVMYGSARQQQQQQHPNNNKWHIIWICTSIYLHTYIFTITHVYCMFLCNWVPQFGITLFIGSFCPREGKCNLKEKFNLHEKSLKLISRQLCFKNFQFFENLLKKKIENWATNF